MPDIARHQHQVVKKRRRRDLFVERIFRMRHAQAAPYLRRIRVEGKDALAVFGRESLEPPALDSRPANCNAIRDPVCSLRVRIHRTERDHR